MVVTVAGLSLSFLGSFSLIGASILLKITVKNEPGEPGVINMNVSEKGEKKFFWGNFLWYGGILFLCVGFALQLIGVFIK